MRHLHDGMKILDMCTGSGCILLSLLHYSNDCVGVGVDISKEALAVAGQNAKRMKALKENLQVSFLQSNLFEVFENPLSDDMDARTDMNAQFDMIVSNPPYIRSDVIQTLMPEVREHEPILALDGTEDGLYFYRNIIKNAGKYLTGGGKLFFEIGYDQGEDVKRLMEQEGYKEVEVIKDFAGLDRVVCGTLQK
jgi:release factor glutamine methyltransferase